MECASKHIINKLVNNQVSIINLLTCMLSLRFPWELCFWNLELAAVRLYFLPLQKDSERLSQN